jgi:hypothetical protein
MQYGCPFGTHVHWLPGTIAIIYLTGALADDGAELVAPGSDNQLT